MTDTIDTTLAKGKLTAKQRQERKIQRRQEARLKFIENLESFGGLLSIKEAAKRTGESEARIYDKIWKGGLVAIDHDNQLLIPSFQFGGTLEVPGLSSLLSALTYCSMEAKITFLLNVIEMPSGQFKTPLEALKDGDPEEIELIMRDAREFLVHTA